MKRQIRSGLAVAVAAALLLLSGCGSAAKQGGSADQPRTDNKGSGNTAAEVKIGLVYPLNGPWATNGINARNGALLAVDVINEKGGIKSLGGAKLVAIVADSGNDPSNAANVARRLINDDKVQAIVGAYLSSFTLTVTTEAERAKVPAVTQSFVDELVTRGYKYTFKTTPLGTTFGSATMQYMREMIDNAKLDIKQVAVVSSNDASSDSQFKGAITDAEKFGFQVVEKLQYPVGMSDVTAIVSKLKSSGAQVLFLGGPLPEEMLIIKTMRAAGLKMSIVGLGGGGILSHDFPKNLGDAADGVLSTASWNWDISEDARQIADRYVQKFGQAFMPQEAGSAFMEVYTAYLGMEKAGSTNPEKVREALLALDTKEFPATMYLGKQIAFDEKGMAKHTHAVFIQYKDGKPRSVWPKEDRQMEPLLK